eukprot:Phypoly_transcript_08673.p1 GENE.Phypoly_transcript_08673~~Phypoly_transcript_08673.p1  ORF type:complete len:413 (+),score=89.24 Phypoly_transcript_08673:160-1398(+)
MNNITAMTENPVFANHGGFIRKILIPIQRAIINWKSGHPVEAMESALACFSTLQHIDQACLYGLLSNFPQLYLLGSLVQIFLEQGQVFLAQQMSDQIKKVCASMSPDLDNICIQMDELILSYSPASPSRIKNSNLLTSQNSNLESTHTKNGNPETISNQSSAQSFPVQYALIYPTPIHSQLHKTSTSQYGNLEYSSNISSDSFPSNHLPSPFSVLPPSPSSLSSLSSPLSSSPHLSPNATLPPSPSPQPSPSSSSSTFPVPINLSPNDFTSPYNPPFAISPTSLLSELNHFPQFSQINSLPQNSQINNIPQNTETRNFPQNSQINNFPQISQINNLQQNSQINNFPQNTETRNFPQNSQINHFPQISQINNLPQNSQINDFPQISQINNLPRNWIEEVALDDNTIEKMLGLS